MRYLCLILSDPGMIASNTQDWHASLKYILGVKYDEEGKESYFYNISLFLYRTLL